MMEAIGFAYVACRPHLQFDSAVYTPNGLEIKTGSTSEPLKFQDIAWYYPPIVQYTLPKIKNLSKKFAADKFCITTKQFNNDVDSQSGADSQEPIIVILLEIYVYVGMPNIKLLLPGISSVSSD